jgi:hypothetical protein
MNFFSILNLFISLQFYSNHNSPKNLPAVMNPEVIAEDTPGVVTSCPVIHSPYMEV